MPSKDSHLSAIQKELNAGREASADGNAGRARVCARRAAGCALSWYATRNPDPEYKSDTIRQLTRLREDKSFPAAVREAALRLSTRISLDFTYPFGEDPLNDARLIIDHITAVMTIDPS